MTGLLPIINRDGKQVATLEWTGTMWRGKGKWTWFESEEVQNSLEIVIKESADLSNERYADMVRDGGLVQGWQGFAGWFQALADVLPAVGMDVDDENIVWPFEVVEAE